MSAVIGFLFSQAGYWCFTGACLICLTLAEYAAPRLSLRPRSMGRLRVLIGVAVIGAAVTYLLQNQLQYPLVELFLPLKFISIAKLHLPGLAIFVVSFLLIDFFYYAFHVLSHRLGWLWRVHKVHHADEHVSALSGLVHHPLETLASFAFVLLLSVMLGVPVLVLAVYGLVAGFHTVFSHADLRLPTSLDRLLRWVIVTPDVHRTHHSVLMDEGNSNFGQILTVWDRLFGTYVDHPTLPEAELVMGLPGSERPAAFSVLALLALPFARRVSRA